MNYKNRISGLLLLAGVVIGSVAVADTRRVGAGVPAVSLAPGVSSVLRIHECGWNDDGSAIRCRLTNRSAEATMLEYFQYRINGTDGAYDNWLGTRSVEPGQTIDVEFVGSYARGSSVTIGESDYPR